MVKHFEKFAGEGINDADYAVTKFGPGPDGKRVRLWVCPFYEKWMNLMRRTAKEGCRKVGPYRNVEICEEWLTFSNFKRWMEQQDWQGKELDKDLIGTGKLYSPDTCMFIPRELNSFLVGRRKKLDKVSVTGITVTTGGYTVQVSGEYGGTYKCIYQAIGQRLSQQISKIRPEWEDHREDICRFFYRRAAEDVKFVRDSDEFPYFHSKPIKPKRPSVEELFEERRKNREGKSFINRKGFKYTVVEYKGTNNVLVKFEDGLEVWTTWYYAERGMTLKKIR